MFSLALCLAILCFCTGCQKQVFSKKTEYENIWACDTQADQAMMRRDYEAGIKLHQRFLEKEPDNGLALYHLGYAYGNVENHENEVYYYERAINLGFNNKDDIFLI
ncbi:MAG: hypothetical protein OMM_10594 [Candidatus Magnetoglobus multicellularis str. Araruama]|uniref:Uncharacterized protein n=1 Tax=Candidatus Magnetoglobus multicellularis str. Araruama TaxID=890399 RepID=A0A1V1P0K1_9BACT|nr:MAG: hypothetical protein OMM_10594 [Candidatus Magnetoglobus multicellularis str. Araruama]